MAVCGTCCCGSSEAWMRTHDKWAVVDEKSEFAEYGACLWNVEAPKGNDGYYTFTETPSNGAKTCSELLQKSVEQYGQRNAVGYRRFVKAHKEDTREKLEYENSYTWLTYKEYHDRIRKLASYFELIRTAGGNSTEQMHIVIYAETQVNWMLAAFAGWRCKAVIVTVYATLGPDAAMSAIKQTHATILVCDRKLLNSIKECLTACLSVEAVVSLDDLGNQEVSIRERISVTSVSSVLDRNPAIGSSSSPSPQGDVQLAERRRKGDLARLPTPTPDLAVIMYTSGTTGNPKGVMLTHANICATVAGVEKQCADLVTYQDVFLAYLPLAHIFEMVAEMCFISVGAALGYGTPHTLTDTGVKLKRPESIGDARCLRPTLTMFVPAVLQKVYDGVKDKQSKLGCCAKKLFECAERAGSRNHDSGKLGVNCCFNIVFRTIQNMVGGRLKAIISGGAPLSPDIQKFCETVLKAPIRQGYGLTETCGASCFGFWADNSLRSVGAPLTNVVIRLADWEEGHYFNEDKDKQDVAMRRGEVLIGGPSVSKGYFIDIDAPDEELKKKNKEDWIDIKGVLFFRTGDIGQITSNGRLQIIDRKKDLWKPTTGEYVSLAKVEECLKKCSIVEISMCYGQVGADYPIALICPKMDKLADLAKELQIKGSHEDLCENEKIIKHLAEDFKSAGKKDKINNFPAKYALIAELWTPENDMLTAAMKMKRPAIVRKHKDKIAKLYGS